MTAPRNEWFELATNDWLTAEFLQKMYPVPIEIITFHCQQAAEKMLKGFLFQMGIIAPRTHNLGIVCQVCAEHDERFHKLAQACGQLTPYGVQGRYPNNLQLAEADMRLALADAKTVIDFVKHIMAETGLSE